MDFFTVQELEELAKKFIEQQENPVAFEEENKRDGTMVNFFDDNMRQAENDRSETLSKIKARRMTKKIDGTVLNRHKNVVTIVHNGQQQIQSQIMKYVQNSVLSVEVVSFPFKWKVRRSHADFITLREYLLRKYPQTVIPPIPRYS